MDVLVGLIVFGVLLCAAYYILIWLLKFIAKATVNLISTILLVCGIILGVGLLIGEANAAVSIAVPASMAVAKMRLSTGGFI